MPGCRVNSNLGLCLAAALATVVAGCSGGSELAENIREGNYFQKPVFTTPDWARARPVSNAELGPKGPVAREDLVDAAGRCAPAAPKVPPQAATAQASAPAAPATPATPPKPTAPPAYGSLAGDLASSPMPQGPPPKPMPVEVKSASAKPSGDLDHLQPEGAFGSPGGAGAPVMGGIALGMTECQAVRRGGQPTSVNIGAGPKGQRKVVVTYLSGPWPGVYTFYSGRLKLVDAAPVQEKPKPKRKYKKKRRTHAKTARGQDVYIQ